MLILFHDTMWGQPLHTGENIEGVTFSTDRGLHQEADAVVFHVPEWPTTQIPTGESHNGELPLVKRPGQLWVAWSMECEEHYPLLRDTSFMRHFDLTMTYRRDSDIPVTYADARGPADRLVEAFRRPPPPKRAQSLLASFISSHFDLSGRQAYLRELANHIAIDSYGTFMRNRTISPDLGPPSKLEALADYKFAIAFENACGHDYVTEKFFEPLWVGSIPIYLGAPNVKDFAPGDRCFINVAEFPDPKKLADYLLWLASDEDAYRSYFHWKHEPFQQSFETLLAIPAQSAFARLAEQVKARLSTAVLPG